MPPYTRKRLETGGAICRETILIVLHENRIAGHAQVFKYPNPRRKVVGDLPIYLHQDFHNKGLGLTMLTELVQQAKKEGLHRMGLHVVTDNKLAVHLYEKLGSKTEGVLQGSYLGDDGLYHDELAMGLVLG